MSRFDDGISGYVKARAVVEVNFPIDWKGNVEIACKHCPFFYRTSCRCGLNQSVVNYPERYVGAECPLAPVEEEKENENV